MRTERPSLYMEFSLSTRQCGLAIIVSSYEVCLKAVLSNQRHRKLLSAFAEVIVNRAKRTHKRHPVIILLSTWVPPNFLSDHTLISGSLSLKKSPKIVEFWRDDLHT